jgi:hypothetical protein
LIGLGKKRGDWIAGGIFATPGESLAILGVYGLLAASFSILELTNGVK